MGDGFRDPVITSIRDKLKPLSSLSSHCCIYRVPRHLRKVNEDAYRPLVASIGPYYYNDPTLQPMQDHKLRYLQSFLRRISVDDMGSYVRFIRERIQDIRNCYAEDVILDDDTFVEMVFIDAVFIIELFLRCWFPRSITNDRILRKPRIINEIKHDIVLEENQLPFFILKDLYNMAFSLTSHSEHIPFTNLVNWFLCGSSYVSSNRLQTSDVQHFVDFLRISHLPSTLRANDLSDNNKTATVFIKETELRMMKEGYLSGKHALFCPSATKLSEAGVRFKARTSKYLLDIRFDKGVLEIPRFGVDDSTDSFYRNIMVFEQCHYCLDTYIIDYFSFLDGLIDTPKDVEILVQNGIIDNWLGSNEEVANLFNRINKHTVLYPERFYYSVICRDLNAHASAPWNRWRATLKHKYFHHPWTAISVIYAILILILTLLQVISGFASK